MRLTPDIRLVASGDGGFSLSDPYDCHVYLVAGLPLPGLPRRPPADRAARLFERGLVPPSVV